MEHRHKKRTTDSGAFKLDNSKFYNEFLAEREEIMRHKWLESEKLGHDIGFERALLDWVMNYRDKWRASRRVVAKTASEK